MSSLLFVVVERRIYFICACRLMKALCVSLVCLKRNLKSIMSIQCKTKISSCSPHKQYEKAWIADLLIYFYIHPGFAFLSYLPHDQTRYFIFPCDQTRNFIFSRGQTRYFLFSRDYRRYFYSLVVKLGYLFIYSCSQTSNLIFLWVKNACISV